MEKLSFEELISLGKEKGFITFDELIEHIDEEALTPELLEDLITQLDEYLSLIHISEPTRPY